MRYALTNKQDGSFENVELNPETCFRDALDLLCLRVEPEVSDDEVREFHLVNEDGTQVGESFFEYLHERACLRALEDLGYELHEEELVEISNLVAFEL
jgi:hypothetical protein